VDRLERHLELARERGVRGEEDGGRVPRRAALDRHGREVLAVEVFGVAEVAAVHRLALRLLERVDLLDRVDVQRAVRVGQLAQLAPHVLHHIRIEPSADGEAGRATGHGRARARERRRRAASDRCVARASGV
jgi:hypothetical protein